MRPSRDKPGAMRRFAFRLPLLLERIVGPHLERLFARVTGVEWLMLETIGRRTGRPHVVLLDVVGRDAEHDVYYVQPAYGREAAWVRNIVAQPTVRVRAGGGRVRARVRDATGTEGAEVVLRFVRAHPRYARLIVYFVGYVERLDRSDDDLRRDLANTPVFAIEVEPERG